VTEVNAPSPYAADRDGFSSASTVRGRRLQNRGRRLVNARYRKIHSRRARSPNAARRCQRSRSCSRPKALARGSHEAGTSASGTPSPGELSALLAEIAAPLSESSSASSRHRLRIGEYVGRFELVRKLGHGGFGVVFEAVDTELGRRVAFKVLKPARRDRSRDELLVREAEAVARLQHPGIVTLHDAGRCDAGPFLILELLRGETLAARLSRGRLASRDAVRVSLAVAEALAHAHAGGVLHRDLKPANVFLTSDGGVKVLDFGRMRSRSNSATAPSTVSSSRDIASPPGRTSRPWQTAMRRTLSVSTSCFTFASRSRTLRPSRSSL
jgi:serine/threonine protein kinase